jgi:hypothetical protein
MFPAVSGGTKGGLNSKLHAVCDADGKPLISGGVNHHGAAHGLKRREDAVEDACFAPSDEAASD